jgi:hypothetical protein
MKAALPVILGALAVGAVVRALSGTPIFQTDLAAAVTDGAPAVGTPEAAVVSFYAALAAGDYARAWELSLEPTWSGAQGATYRDAVQASASADGWTTRGRFVSRCSEDIGDGLRLNGIQAERIAAAPDTAEAQAVTGRSPVGLCGVHASGQMLGACLIYRWDRDLSVAEIDGVYKVVLPGTKAGKAFFHQSWFSNLTLVASLRSAGK